MMDSFITLPQSLPRGLTACSSGELGIFIGIHAENPYTETLRLIPKIVTLGIGCRRDTPMETIFAAVKEVLGQYRIDTKAVCQVASIDVKADEGGLLECARVLNAQTVFYTADELNAVPGEFAESEFVRKTVGVGNICERAAVCGGEELMIPKTVKDGVTVGAVRALNAASSGAALLGSPLTCDFAVISLSDLLTPMEVIEKRIEGAAMSDLCVVSCNVRIGDALYFR